VPGVVGSEESVVEDSFYNGLLDYPEYTRPQEYKEKQVPDILLSGDHGKVDRWRKKQALEKTLCRRPDLLEKKDLSSEEEELLAEIKQELGKED
jgi:tRNA (guanine37-N1)-methyltransferase